MQTKRNTQNHIFVAFPGMGKTTYALSHSGIVDLDFGYLRSALQVPKDNQHTIYAAYQRLASYYFREGYDILTNDQGLIPFLKQFAEGDIVMVLPLNNDEHAVRVMQREAGRNGNKAFAKALKENIDTWADDWAHVANKYHIPIHHVRYFEEVADEYRKV